MNSLSRGMIAFVAFQVKHVRLKLLDPALHSLQSESHSCAPSMHWKAYCGGKFFTRLSLSPSLSCSIFVPHCDYMLTDHLHGYQHLCRYIDEEWKRWSVFLQHQCLAAQTASSHPVGNLHVVFKPNRSETWHHISFHPLAFIFACGRILTSQSNSHPLPPRAWAS